MAEQFTGLDPHAQLAYLRASKKHMPAWNNLQSIQAIGNMMLQWNKDKKDREERGEERLSKREHEKTMAGLLHGQTMAREAQAQTAAQKAMETKTAGLLSVAQERSSALLGVADIKAKTEDTNGYRDYWIRTEQIKKKAENDAAKLRLQRSALIREGESASEQRKHELKLQAKDINLALEKLDASMVKAENAQNHEIALAVKNGEIGLKKQFEGHLDALEMLSQETIKQVALIEAKDKGALEQLRETLGSKEAIADWQIYAKKELQDSINSNNITLKNLAKLTTIQGINLNNSAALERLKERNISAKEIAELDNNAKWKLGMFLQRSAERIAKDTNSTKQQIATSRNAVDRYATRMGFKAEELRAETKKAISTAEITSAEKRQGAQLTFEEAMGNANRELQRDLAEGNWNQQDKERFADMSKVFINLKDSKERFKAEMQLKTFLAEKGFAGKQVDRAFDWLKHITPNATEVLKGKSAVLRKAGAGSRTAGFSKAFNIPTQTQSNSIKDWVLSKKIKPASYFIDDDDNAIPVDPASLQFPIQNYFKNNPDVRATKELMYVFPGMFQPTGYFKQPTPIPSPGASRNVPIQPDPIPGEYDSRFPEKPTVPFKGLLKPSIEQSQGLGTDNNSFTVPKDDLFSSLPSPQSEVTGLLQPGRGATASTFPSQPQQSSPVSNVDKMFLGNGGDSQALARVSARFEPQIQQMTQRVIADKQQKGEQVTPEQAQLIADAVKMKYLENFSQGSSQQGGFNGMVA